jgi:N-acetylmuramoyl-L-alanine amidase
MAATFKNKFSITQTYIPSPSKRRSGLRIAKVRFLVAHDTGNPKSTASQNVRYYINSRNEISASAHIFVDDKEIIECVPALTAAPEKAWHVLYGVPKDNELYGVNANDAAIGVEYCYGGTIDADKAYQKYVWVLAKLCFEFDLDPSKDIVGHFFLDPKRKTDPVTGLANSRRTYEQLLRDVVLEYNDCAGIASTPVNENTEEQGGSAIVAVKLNVRKEPNTRADIVQVLSPGTTVNFVAIVNNGQAINNNAVWYKDTNGNYFWSGGVKTE